MSPYGDDWLTVHGGDCRTVMAEMEPDSIQTVVTSPPYFQLRSYPVPDVVWPALTGLRLCDEGTHEWGEPMKARQKNNQHVGGRLSADRAGGGRAARGVDAGRACERCGGWLGQLGREPNPWMYAAHIADVFHEVLRVLRPDGTVWLNLADSYATVRYQRGDVGEVIKKGDLLGIPWMVALALRARGWWLRTDVVWEKPNAMPESPGDRPSRVHEFLFLLSKTGRYQYDVNASREPSGDKAGRQEWTEGGTRRARDVWSINTVSYPDAHYAVFPPDLVSRCLRLTSRPMQTVLDPFAGSGTVGMVAQSLSRKAVLIDAAPDYLLQQMKRAGQTPLGMEGL